MSKHAKDPAAVIEIATVAELHIFKQMLDKHEKGTTATINAVESFGGDRHAMDNVLACIAQWRRQTALQLEALAPAGDAAATGTPMGAVLDAAKDAERREDAADAAAPLPDGAPMPGQLIWWSRGQATSIVSVLSARVLGDPAAVSDVDGATAYAVEDAEGWRGEVVKHHAEGGSEWRVLTATLTNDYPTATIYHPSLAQVVAAQESSDPADAPPAEDYPKEGRPRASVLDVVRQVDANADAKARGWKSAKSIPADAEPGEHRSSYAMRTKKPTPPKAGAPIGEQVSKKLGGKQKAAPTPKGSPVRAVPKPTSGGTKRGGR